MTDPYSTTEIPAALIDRFRKGRVALFIGAGCSRSAGLPGWEQLLRDLHAEIEKNNKLDSTAKGNFKAYFKRRNYEEFPNIAEYCKKIDAKTYNEFMQRVFDPPLQSKRLKAPDYISWLRQFPFLKWIVTTNFDLLLEDALGSDWAHLTWQDSAEFARYLREDRKLIFHVHGMAQRLSTLVHTRAEYQDLSGQNGDSAVKFMQRMFEQNAILFVGYGLGDPVIQWVSRAMRVDFNSTPDMYSLVPNADAAQCQNVLEQNGVRLVSYAQGRKLDVPTDYDNALKSWFVSLAEAIGVPLAKEVEAFSMPATEDGAWLELRKEKIQAIPAVSVEDRRRFLNGEAATWALVRDGYTAKRKTTSEALECLKQPGFRAVLITGAGGEGKSTILKQIALDLLAEGYAVHVAEEPDESMFERIKSSRTQTALIVDHADLYRNWQKLLRYAQNASRPIKLVLSARTNEWRYANSNGLGEQERNLVTVPVRKLSPEEISDIAGLVWNAKATKLPSKNDVEQKLKNDTNGFLLAAMLVATRGAPLTEILRDVLRQIAHQKRGTELVHALGIVVALESRSNREGRPYFCSARLFQEVLGVSRQQMNAMCHNLVGEISLHLKGGYQVQTRHPAIAQIVFQVLFRDEPPMLEELPVHEDLLAAAGRIAKETVRSSEQKLLSVIPLMYKRERDIEAARLLFRSGTDADPYDAHTWQAWALMEKEQGNVGKLTEEYTARWMFKRGTDADPHDAPTWQAWALMEKEQGNVGKLTEEYTARWMFKRGTDADPHDAHTWQAWALMEKEQGNVGKLTEEYTARWMFKRGTDADPHNAPLWQAWALMEKEQGNVGKLTEEYTARWMFKRGTDTDPNHAPLWQAWALMEKEQGNVGKLSEEYTARWMFKRGTDADPHDAHTWQAWALMEKEQGNVGKLSEEYTARWMFKRGTDADPHNAPTWQAWALMELEQHDEGECQRLITEGLRHRPDAPELVYLQNKLNHRQQTESELAATISGLLAERRTEDAGNILRDVMFRYPRNEEFARLFMVWRELG
ncbi:MAG: SIR2 family protein [Sideroxydans sp.]|nr:SIR2 family protein [Sideroxydans sp.]